MNSDNPEEPLIASSRELDDDDTRNGAARPVGSGKAPEDAPGLFVWLLTFAAGISGILFGCEFPGGRHRRSIVVV
jgi:SP family myo-inositol transporter-like MFS transporter 13